MNCRATITIFFLLLAAQSFAQTPSSRFFYSGDGRINFEASRVGVVFDGPFRNPDGTYQKSALKQIGAVFGADFNFISLRLIEFLDFLQDNLNGGKIIVASGYRSPEYNTALRERGALAGKASLHQYGMAADIKMERVSSKKLWEYVRGLGVGGAGWYHGKNVHVDVGPARWWDEKTSKVGTDIADENKVIMLVTDRDIYRPGETINFGFARMTAWPIGVQPEFALEQTDGKTTKKIIPSPLVGEGPGEGCHIFSDWRPMLAIPWQIPVGRAPGRYLIRAKFCDNQWSSMPSEIATNEFIIEER